MVTFRRILCCFAVFCLSLSAENLTVESIFRHPQIWGTAPNSVTWSEDSKKIAFLWNDQGERFRDVYIADISRNKVYRLTNFQALPDDYRSKNHCPHLFKDNNRFPDKGISRITWFPDSQHLLAVYNGNFYRVHYQTQVPVKPWVWTEAIERSPQFSSDGKYCVFTRDNDLWMKETEGGSEIQLTSDGNKFIQNGVTCHRKNPGDEDLTRWSPNSEYLAFVQRITSRDTPHIDPDCAGDKLHCGMPVQCRAGRSPALTRVGIINIRYIHMGPVWLHLPETTKFYLRDMEWSPDSKQIALETAGKSGKSRTIILADIQTGALDTIYSETTQTWVRDSGENLIWIKQGTRLLFSSDRSGWNHLYELDPATSLAVQLTRGRWEVMNYSTNRSDEIVHFSGNREYPSVKHTYELNLRDGEIKQVTYSDGWHDYVTSPDGKSIAYIFSKNNEPPDLYRAPSKPQSTLKRLTFSTLPEFSQYTISPPDFLEIQNDLDGKTIHVKVWAPRGIMSGQAYPLIIYLHDEGYAQSNRQEWEILDLYHQFLSENGYVVADVDYRGSSGYGRDWRTDVYRHLGYLDLSDITSVVNHLCGKPFVDKNRIGIWGTGYGGFLTEMALFKHPEIYTTGVSVAGITDWTKYDPGFTSRRLGCPAEDSLAYQKSSPLNFARALQGNLLIVHGFRDTRVPFQHTLSLIDQLVQHGKHYDSLIYPEEDHRFILDDNRIHLFTAIKRYFDTHLSGSDQQD